MRKRVFQWDGIWRAENDKTRRVFEVRNDRPPKMDWTDVGRPFGLNRKEKIRKISRCLLRFEKDGVTVLPALLEELQDQ